MKKTRAWQHGGFYQRLNAPSSGVRARLQGTEKSWLISSRYQSHRQQRCQDLPLVVLSTTPYRRMLAAHKTNLGAAQSKTLLHRRVSTSRSPHAAHERDGGSFTFLSQKMLANPLEQDLDTAENATGEVSSQRKCFARFPFPPKTSDIHICLQNRVCYCWWQDISLGTALSFGLRLFSSW